MQPENLGPNGPTESPTRNTREIEVVRTYLSMPSLQALIPKETARTAHLLRLDPCTEAQWRALYRQIGAEWHWHDRDAWDQGRIQQHLARADVRIYQVWAEWLDEPSHPAGFLELERHDDGTVEIVYLGLDKRAFGRGLGAWLVTEAVRVAFAWNAARVWLHTCTLDSPAALPNYLARGFVVDRTERYHTRLPI